MPPEELVVGDVLKVGPGDQIVLDGKMIGDGKMQVDESQLTGESNLVPKQSGDAVFSGSFCVNGSALFVVEKVGTHSLTNQITAGARAFRRVLTPLQNEVYLVVRIMLAIVIYLEFLLFLDAYRPPMPAEASPARRWWSAWCPTACSCRSRWPTRWAQCASLGTARSCSRATPSSR